MFPIEVKRIYLPPHPEDGQRILVDRLWPRGLTKEAAKVDLWLKEIAPSPDLRKWFCHQPDLFPEFRKRYIEELLHDPAKQKPLARLKELAQRGKITLLYASKDEEHNQAIVLREFLLAQAGDPNQKNQADDAEQRI